jgi:hypothetical protein
MVIQSGRIVAERIARDVPAGGRDRRPRLARV